MNFNKQQLAQPNPIMFGRFWFRSTSGIKYAIALFAFFLMTFTTYAQHDVALEKTVDMDSVAIGDIVTFSVKVLNQNATNVGGLQVRDTLTSGLFYLDHIAPAGTTYDLLTGVWMVNSMLDATTPELTLTIRVQVLSEGMFMNIAEVIDMAGTDVDSEPDNEQLLEDDMDKACVSVPVTICTEIGDMVRVTLLSMFTDIQWYKDGVVIPANQGGNQDTFFISSAGIYSFTALESGCPTRTCCPVVVKDSCYDLALRKVLAFGQDDIVPVESEVNYVLELTNQGDLAANTITVWDDVDPSIFAPFSETDNPNGNTGGDVSIPYTWSAQGNDGQVLIKGLLQPGQTVTIPVKLTVLYPGQADNFAEIFTDDDRDRDSQPEAQELDENSDVLVDDEINNNGGDEDDHDIASLMVLAATLGDFVWFDNDHNGQQDTGEPGVREVIVNLYDSNDNLIGKDTTDANGGYLFDNLPPGSYYVIFDVSSLPANYSPTLSNNGPDMTDSDGDFTGRTQAVTLAMGDTDLDLDFGIEPDPASVGDFVWFDEDMNGQQDMGEMGVPDVHVYLYDADDNLIGKDTTDANGNYLFTGLDPDDYYVVFDVNTLPMGYSPTTANSGNDATDSDGDATGMTGTFSLSPGEQKTDIDFGLDPGPADVGDFVWFDEDGNGQQDGGEMGVPDVIVHLYDNDGNLIATDTTDANGEYLFSGVEPGDYFVIFDPMTFPPNYSPTTANNGSDITDSDADDMGTTGTFTVLPGDDNLNIDLGLEPNPASVGDFVWNDADHNGQQDTGEPGVSGVIVFLYDTDDNLIATDTTNSDGSYLFDGLDAGGYYVVFDVATLPTNFSPTTANTGDDATDSDGDASGTTGAFTLVPGEEKTDIDFGIESDDASVGDFVWVDADHNGQQDAGEMGVPDVIVRLYDSNDNLIVTDTTDANGGYLFTGLDPDDYYVVFDTGTLPANFTPTTANSGDDATDSDGDTTGTTGTFSLSAGEQKTDIDYGIEPDLASIGDFVWTDGDGNGQQDAGEMGVPDVIVNLYDGDGNLIAIDTTDANGEYGFAGLDPDDYYVVFDPGSYPSGFSPTIANNGNDNTDSDADNTGTTGTINLSAGENNTTIDMGLEPVPASVGDFVWNDADHNGQQDMGEAGVSDVYVYLYDTDDNLIATDTTNSDGSYLFDGLDAGDYYVVFDVATIPTNFSPTTANMGNDNTDSDGDANGLTAPFSLAPGEDRTDIDFGIESDDASVGDFVWVDADHNGQQDAGETGVPDVYVYLYDSDDNLIATDTTDANGGYLFTGLDPDDYYVVFDIGTLPANFAPTTANMGDDLTDSDGDAAGMTGTFSLSAGEQKTDIDFGIDPDPASVGDFVWIDENSNGQQDFGEMGVSDVTVYLYDGDGNLIATDTTDANGEYGFTGLDIGDYYIVFDVTTLPSGHTPTLQNNGNDATDSDGDATGTTGTFTLTAGENNTTIDFGIDPAPASLGDFVWEDSDMDGQQDMGEMGVPDVYVYLYDTDDNLIATDTTDANGAYLFDSLDAGGYYVVFDVATLPSGFSPTTPNQGNDFFDSDGDATGTTGTITLNPGEFNNTIDFGLSPESASVGDFVWIDGDGNGQQDTGEAGVSGVIVNLYDSDDNFIGTDTTDANGAYLFDGLDAGDYYVVFDTGSLPTGFSPTVANMGDDATDSDGDATGTTSVFSLSTGQDRTDIDFGIESDDASVGNFVWDDTDFDGLQDTSEVGIEGVVIYLYDTNDDLIATDTSDANGGYLFAGLDAGDYYIVFDTMTLPSLLYVPTTPNNGDDTLDSDGDEGGVTSVFTLTAGEHNPDIDFGAFVPMFDLALEKVLAPGQTFNVDVGEEVSYFIKITNEGVITAHDIQIIDLIPAGLLFSPNNSSDWTLITTDSAECTLPGPLAAGETDSIEIKMIVQYGASGASITNVAEIEGAQDEHGIFVNDSDSTPNNGDPDEDDIDDEMIELINHDPTGWIYCDKTGKIITGGTISVTGPNGNPNTEVAIISDGSTGFYEFYAIGEPGVYTITYNGIYPMSPTCLPMPDTLDPTFLATPVVLGLDTLNSMILADTDCGLNPYYLNFDLENGDPSILLNNIPVQCSFIGAIVCEDTNNNELPDPTDSPIAGATVYLYDCADLNIPLDSVVTNSLGEYSFDGLEPGNYIVGVNVPDDSRIVTGGPIDANGFSSCIVLNWGDCDSTTNICFAICPQVVAGNDLIHCNPLEETQLNATVPFGSGDFSWSPTTGLDDPNIADPNASPSVTTTYTVTYDDGLGCVTTDSLTIEVGCSTPYLAYTPFADSTNNCNDPMPFESPVFTDDCDNNLSISLDSVTVPNPCGFVRTRTWTVLNNCGNGLTFEQMVTLTDNLAPVAIEPNDTTVSCNSIPGPETPTFTDNCDNDLTINYTQTIDSTNCGQVEITRMWQATDDCGNSFIVDRIINVIDDVAPQIVFTHPWLAGLSDGDTLVMECDNTDLFSDLDAQAVDECCDATMTFVENGITPGNCTTDGFIVIMHCTWTATDENGNSTSLTLHMRIEDNNPPVFTDVPGDITVSCGQPVPDCTIPAITDACSNPVITPSSLDTVTVDGYDRICSWSATDACGNTSTGSYTIHVITNAGPTITGVPGDLTVNLPNGDTIPDMATVVAVDGCTNDPLPVGTFEVTSPYNGCEYTITRTWTVTETGGDMTILTQVITVIDGISFTLDSTTSDTCGLGIGTASFSPNTYTYSWSDGGTGDTRNDLLAGIYNVTIANGTCTDSTQVIIDDNCDCQMPVLESIDLAGAGCGQMNGGATVNLVGNESLYEYLWIPNLGVPNADGNGRTSLPSQRYVVIATYQGQTDCLEKFEFEVTDDCFDCPDIIEVEAMITNSMSSPATVCVSVPLGVSTERDITMNGVTYSGTLAGCDEATVRGYNYGGLPGNGVNGNYSVVWKRGAKTFYTVVENMDQLAAKMAYIDFNGGWQNIPAEQTIITTNLFGANNELEILHVPTEAVVSLTLQQLEVALGTEFIIPEGLNEIVMDGLGGGCSDTALVTVNLTQIGTVDPVGLDDETIGKENGTEPVVNLTQLRNDTLKTHKGEPVTADLMANDFIDGEYNCFEIVRQPDHGYVTVSESYAVTYRPFNDFCNTGNEEPMDKFFYEICTDDGKRHTAVAFIEVECGGDIKLYPNPVDRIVNIDLSPFAGQAVGLKIFNDLGVCVETIWIGEAVTTPMRVDMEFYRAGHYTFWVQPETGKAKVLQLIKVRF